MSQSDKISLPKSSSPNSDILKNKLDAKRVDNGWAGKLFGSNEHTSVYVGWFITSLLLLFAISYTFAYLYYTIQFAANSSTARTDAVMLPNDVWRLVIPVVTAFLGYLFGTRGRRASA